MVGQENSWSFSQWASYSELDKIDIIESLDDLPFKILVLASQDPSFAVRSVLLSKFELLTQIDISWLSLLKRMSKSDPDGDLRHVALSLLENLSGAS